MAKTFNTNTTSKNTDKISVEIFCDLKGVVQIDRMALKRHYPKDTKTVEQWIEELKDKIVLR